MDAFQQLRQNGSRPRNHDHQAGKHRIMIYGRKSDGSYIVECREDEAASTHRASGARTRKAE